MTENISERIITTNRKARHEYHIDNTFEAGIVLQGTEVKALRQNKANLVDSYASIDAGELWLNSLNIGVYDHGNINNHDPVRRRKLLIHKKEIRKLIGKTKEKGLTLIPLRLYFKRGKVKVEIALARGKKMYDKRDAIAKRDFQRDQERKIKY